MQLILLRHGESQWNLENRFTGWKDVELTPTGREEASFAGNQLLKFNIDINSIHTSLLKRATQTTDIVADIIGFSKDNIKYDWRLNERHYGALQGLNKSETAAKYGEEQVHIWRRSYDTLPPLLSEDDVRYIELKNQFKDIESSILKGESLKNVITRLGPFWNDYNNIIQEKDGNHLIIAHSNSLRAIIKILDSLSSDEIISVNIPTGVPLVYKFDLHNKVIEKKYLIDEDILQKKQKIIENQGREKK